MYILIEGGSVQEMAASRLTIERYYRRVLGDKRDKHKRNKYPNYHAVSLKACYKGTRQTCTYICLTSSLNLNFSSLDYA